MTRRQLLAAGSVATLAAILDAAPASASSADDAGLARSALEFELLAVVVYRHVLGAAALTPRATSTLRHLLAHERAHARALTHTLTALGAPSPPAPASIVEADAQLKAHHASASLSRAHTERDCLELLLDVEAIAEGIYFGSLSKLADPGLIQLAAEIMAAEAQHSTALSDLLHPGDLGRAVPDAFVQGKK